MYKTFYIYKRSGTYSETLEAFGLCKLVDEILQRLKISDRKVTIEDLGLYYQVNSSQEITVDQIDEIKYFQVFKFLINKSNTPVPNGILKTDCFDYPTQKQEQNNYKEEYKRISENKKLTKVQQNKAKEELIKRKLSEFGEKIDPEYDVYRELIKNPYPSYKKLYDNFYMNKEHFPLLIKEVLSYYSNKIIKKRNFKLVDETPTAQQLFNPNQGKGLNKTKANNTSMGNLKSSWISETMKVSGSLSMMSVQYVKVGSGYDLKIYVPEFNNIQFREGLKLIKEFKRYLKSASPVKLDILNILDFVIHFIKLTPEYRNRKVKNTVNGIHSVYQKDLGQNKAVTNIAFFNTPYFIEYSNKTEGREWIDILQEQRNIISSIKELGDSIQGLQHYRNFLGSKGKNAFNYFSDFVFFYNNHLMSFLSRLKPEEDNKRPYYQYKSFKIETLTKFYKNMETNEFKLAEIINNEGFKAVAYAIRKSSVTLQYTPKSNRKFDIRYGLAQQLQNKSKTKEDLATFIGEFISTYNAETARNAERNDGKSFRANIKDEELIQFFTLLDQNPSRLVGAVLASYGFALNKKEVKDNRENDN